MGADIHYILQKLEGDKWLTFSDDENPEETDPINDLNYPLFAFLADVRNRWMLEPICEPRGLPADICPDPFHDDFTYEHPTHGEVDVWFGDHSHGWFLASELLEVGPPMFFMNGWITEEYYADWDKVSEPEEWVPFEQDDWVKMIVWDTKEDITPFFIYLQYLVDKHKTEIRIVFGFDN